MTSDKKSQDKRTASLAQLAELVEGSIVGSAELQISGVSGVKEAGPGEITFVANPKYLADLSATQASAIILSAKSSHEGVDSLKDRGISLLLVEDPYFAFAQMLKFFFSSPVHVLGVSPQAVIGKDMVLGEDLSIHPLVRLEDRVKIGSRTTIGSGSFVGEGSEIGDDCIIYPNVTIREGVRIGHRVILHSGVVLGSDGYGFVTKKGKHFKILQVGGVMIGDDVEMGANVTVDRAAMGTTVIGRGTKIDNQVHIGHNVTIGEDCLIVAQVGISGSTEIGKNVILAGQVGVVGHVKIGDGVRVGAASAVLQSVASQKTVSGSPAIDHQRWLRVQGTVSKLPEMKKKIRELEKKLVMLEESLNKKEGKP